MRWMLLNSIVDQPGDNTVLFLPTFTSATQKLLLPCLLHAFSLAGKVTNAAHLVSLSDCADDTKLILDYTGQCSSSLRAH